MQCARRGQESRSEESGESLWQTARGSDKPRVGLVADDLADAARPAPDVVIPIPRSGSWSVTPATTAGEGSRGVLVSPEDELALAGVAEYFTCGLPRAEIMEYLRQRYGLVFAADLSKHLSPVTVSWSGIRR